MSEIENQQHVPQEGDEATFEFWLNQWLDGDGEAPDVFLARHPQFRLPVETFLEAEQAFRVIRQGLTPLQEPSLVELAQRLGEDYEPIGELGHGGMGVVLLARQRSLNRLVAIKFLNPWFASRVRSSARFIQEAQAIAKLQYGGIVTIYTLELEPARGGPYFVMEYVPGVPLDRLLADLRSHLPQMPTQADLLGAVVRSQAKEPMEEGEGFKGLWDGGYTGFCCRLVADVARALDHAHGKHVIHRDVKPSNILLGLDGRPRLVDFGLARLIEEEAPTASSEVVGTIAYMAPEQLDGQGGEVTPQTDVYALGLTLYELVTLQRAFAGESTAGLIAQITSKDPIPPRRLQPTLHRELEAIILKAIEKEPARRYRSAAAFAEDLSCFLEYKPVTAKPIGLIGRLFRRIRRHPWVSLLLALLLLTTTGLGWFATSFQPDHLSVEANRLWDQGDLEGAKRLFLDVIWYRPHDANALTSLGILSNQLDETEVAERYLGEALKIDPTNTSALTTLAGMREDQERLDDAVELYRRALRVSPSDTYTWSNLGDALALRKWSSKSEMIGYLQDRGFLEEEMPELLYHLGLAYARQQKVRQACDVWLHVRTLDISGWRMRFSLARALDKHACEAIQR